MLMIAIRQKERGKTRNDARRYFSFQKATAALVTVMVLMTGTAFAAGLTVVSVAKNGSLGVLPEYRWVLEEDTTYHIVPGSPVSSPLALRFHSSYMPVVNQGDETDFPVSLDPAKRYFVSVLPKLPGTFSIGGASLVGNGNVTVYVNALPLPTAQISVFIHEDIAPINNAWDQGEQGLAGFNIVLEEAGGRYGMSAGTQMSDAYGNMLGTRYLKTCDQGGSNPGTGAYGCLDVNGMPIPLTDAGGTPVVEPMITGPDGRLTIKNLAPGKYGITAVPPDALVNQWIQTTTIEGTRVIDAWVKSNEPTFFSEFGPPSPHVSIGFAPAGPHTPYIDSTVLTGGATITGRIVNQHLSRPPNTVFYSGEPLSHTTPWVGLNLGAAGKGKGVYAGRAMSDGSFSIPGVPPGSYQLVVWDDSLDILFTFKGVTVTGTGNLALGDVPVFQWFTRQEHWVYHDTDENGFRDSTEPGLVAQAINLRWRDGSMYQSLTTDGQGFAPFDQVFPFFSWLVAEVDFTRFKATGLTVTVDDGGQIPLADPWSWEGQLTPQAQGNPLDLDSSVTTTTYRTETGPVLTQGFQGFLGQTSVFEWGKAAYGPGENGGISGVVYYAVTRAEDDPELAAVEPWEPGIPRVEVNLYLYDDLAVDGKGTLVNTTVTDSWDDAVPANCQYGANAGSGTDDPYSFRGVATDCFDGMRNWNQVRPGVFDGGYAFDSIIDPADGVTVISPVPPGRYIVEVVPPTGYEVIKSQDKNVDFGDTYIPSPQLLPPQCMGATYTVPASLSLFPGTPAPLAGQDMRGCESKLVALFDGSNAAADFGLFTQVPVAGHIVGIILDDTATEFVANSPNIGEKFAPPFLPIAIRDWTGRMITSTYSGEFGAYNLLVPSTYSANLPKPSGMSPNMLTACMNDPEADSIGGFYNPQYSTFCYTLQYMPGVTTYLDTPVVPVAAFAGLDKAPVDCQFSDGTPRIFSVTNDQNQGPYLPVTGGTITITSVGSIAVPNPAYDGVGGLEPKTVVRDFGFGNTIGQISIGGVPVTPLTWTNTTITGTVAAATPTGELVVVRGDNGAASTTGVTLQVGLRAGSTVRTVSAGGSIQSAIDAAGVNDLILVAPGIYSEMVIMYKPVQLQGWGEGTIISASQTPAEKLATWREKVLLLHAAGAFDYVNGQGNGFGGVQAGAFDTEEGAGVLVLANDGAGSGLNNFSASDNQGARIDGLTIRSASTGGGIVVNGFVDYLEISNNRLVGNSGFFGGGVRIGHPFLTYQVGNQELYTDSDNDFITLHNNVIASNGALSGAGGGVSLYNGTDNYTLSNNFICGNFTMRDGAGVAQYGLSDNSLIADNTIIFNENFNQMLSVNGGGLSISGQAPLQGQAASPGTGSVSVARNLIQGNAAGSGDGGGIHLNRINGLDVEASPTDSTTWYSVDIINNMISNNVAALAGAGISIQDVVRARLLNNTITGNDNTSTAGEAFAPGVLNQSSPQPGAGITSRSNSPELAAVLPLGEPGFSNPTLEDNIIWHNRSFFFLVDDTNPTNVLTGLCPDIGGAVGLGCSSTAVYDDIAVLPLGAGTMTPVNSVLSGNPDPEFVNEYSNGDRLGAITSPEAPGVIMAAAAFDEGGNFIRLQFGPLTTIRVAGPSVGQPYGDYHLQLSSPAINAGIDTGLLDDFDAEARPFEALFDIGADEVQQPAAPAGAPQPAIAQLAHLGPAAAIADVATATPEPVPAESVVAVSPAAPVQESVAPVSVSAKTVVQVTAGQDVPATPVVDGQSSLQPVSATPSVTAPVASGSVPENQPVQTAGATTGAAPPVADNTVISGKTGTLPTKSVLFRVTVQPRRYGSVSAGGFSAIVEEQSTVDIKEESSDVPTILPSNDDAAPEVVAAATETIIPPVAPLQVGEQLSDLDELQRTRDELADADNVVARSMKDVVRVRKDPAHTDRELERAVEILERAMFGLMRAADDLALVRADVAGMLEVDALTGPEAKKAKNALKKAGKELGESRQIMAKAEQHLAKANNKG